MTRTVFNKTSSRTGEQKPLASFFEQPPLKQEDVQTNLKMLLANLTEDLTDEDLQRASETARIIEWAI